MIEEPNGQLMGKGDTPPPDVLTPHPAIPTSRQMEVMEKLRAYSSALDEVSKRFADSLELHSRDAVALIEIFQAEERGTPLSPARLAERIGLTSGATSSLLNRLEKSGHIERTRIHADRRIVTLQATPGVRDIADAFFQPLAEHLGQMMDGYSDELLGQFDDFVTDLTVSTENFLREA